MRNIPGIDINGGVLDLGSRERVHPRLLPINSNLQEGFATVEDLGRKPRAGLWCSGDDCVGGIF